MSLYSRNNNRQLRNNTCISSGILPSLLLLSIFLVSLESIVSTLPIVTAATASSTRTSTNFHSSCTSTDTLCYDTKIIESSTTIDSFSSKQSTLSTVPTVSYTCSRNGWFHRISNNRYRQTLNQWRGGSITGSTSSTEKTATTTDNDETKQSFTDNDTTDNTNYYESIRTLDTSGDAIQLRHAVAAANEQGRLIIIIRTSKSNCYFITYNTIISSKSDDNKDYVSYLRNDNDDDDDIDADADVDNDANDDPTVQDTVPMDDFLSTTFHKHKQYTRTRRTHTKKSILTPIQRMTIQVPIPVETSTVQQQQNNDYVVKTIPIIYAVCTGYMGDAIWLLKQMQFYCKTVEERYSLSTNSEHDDISIPICLGPIVGILLRSLFWGYDNTNSNTAGAAYTSQSMVMSILNSGSDDNTITTWPRPIGVRTALVTIMAKKKRRQQMSIATALSSLLSSKSKSALALASSMYNQNNNTTLSDTIKNTNNNALTNINDTTTLQNVSSIKSSSSSTSNDDVLELLVQIIEPTGIVRTIQYRDDDEMDPSCSSTSSNKNIVVYCIGRSCNEIQNRIEEKLLKFKEQRLNKNNNPTTITNENKNHDDDYNSHIDEGDNNIEDMIETDITISNIENIVFDVVSNYYKYDDDNDTISKVQLHVEQLSVKKDNNDDNDDNIIRQQRIQHNQQDDRIVTKWTVTYSVKP